MEILPGIQIQFWNIFGSLGLNAGLFLLIFISTSGVLPVPGLEIQESASIY